MIHFVVPAAQDFGFADYLAVNGGGLRQRCEIIPYESLPERSRFRTGTYVFSALDQLTPAMRQLAAELQVMLRSVPEVHVLNDPQQTLRRFDLLSTLKRLGRNHQAVARATGDWRGLRYPVFLRSERKHTGSLSGLLHSPREIEAAIGRALVRGDQLDDLLAVEFVDTADPSGVYRKYAAFVVGGRVIARHLAVGTSWMLKHSAVVYSLDLAREHLRFVETNPHEHELSEIAAIANVGYGRIDYAIKDGRVNVWEINLNPTIGPRPGEEKKPEPDEVRAVRDATRALFYRRLGDAFDAIDIHGDAAAAIQVRFDPRLARAALLVPGRSRFGTALRQWLQPAKPIMTPVVTRSARLLGRLARTLR